MNCYEQQYSDTPRFDREQAESVRNQIGNGPGPDWRQFWKEAPEAGQTKEKTAGADGRMQLQQLYGGRYGADYGCEGTGFQRGFFAGPGMRGAWSGERQEERGGSSFTAAPAGTGGYRIVWEAQEPPRKTESPAQAQGQDKGRMEGETSVDLMKFPVGMTYVPLQRWEKPYGMEQAFLRGTIFADLDLPFSEGRCR